MNSAARPNTCRFSASPVLPFLPVALAVPILLLGLDRPAFMDHEGRYAEVAREMLFNGDWVTPHLNFTVFLNKPPLPYWLTALTFQLCGPTEYARVWPAMTGLLVLAVTIRLGQMLSGRRAGLLAGLVLLTSGGFFLESRLLRPDLLMTLWLCTALLGVAEAMTWLSNRDSEGTKAASKATRWMVLSAASLGMSVLTKGMVGLVLAGGIIAITLVWTRQLGLLRRVPWALVLGVGLLVISPWHVLAGMRNEGFWWDYVVNQHALFFFDQKFPRDSLPDALPVFWGAFFGRMFPWLVFVPVAVWGAIRQAREERALSAVVPLAWLGMVLGFFSLSPSRLEHYTIPALPPAALLIGHWWARLAPEDTAGSRTATVALLVSGLLGLIGVFALPTFLATEEWAREFPVLLVLARWVCGGWALMAGVAAFVRGKSPRRTHLWAFGILACAAVPLFWGAHRALVAIEPVNSWKPLALRLAALLPPDGEAVFAASDEYQICGGLNFYSRLPLSILLPDGYIPPTYLRLDGQSGFLTQTEFAARWQSPRPLLLIVDPERPDADPHGWTPPPLIEVGRWGERRMFANPAWLARNSVTPHGRQD